MKKSVMIALVGLTLAYVGGCVTKFHVIEDGSNTNNVQRVSSSFNDESYIWETWSFSTNRVDK